MNQQKGLVPILIILLIALAVGGYLVYANYSNNRNKLSVSIPTPAGSVTSPAPTGVGETANWKTYTDTYFLFRYPSGWTEKDKVLTGSGFIQTIDDSSGMYEINLTARGNYNNGTGKPYNSLVEFIGKENYQTKEMIVDRREVLRLLPKLQPTTDSEEKVNQIIFFSTDKKFIYVFGLTIKPGQPISRLSDGNKLFNQILSTFRFTN